MNSSDRTATAGERRTSFLVRVGDAPGALEKALHVFASHGINLTHIESRPRRGGSFDIYIDCDVDGSDPAMASVRRGLREHSVDLLVLDHKKVPWFPRHISELDRVSGQTLDAGEELSADHPGFSDQVYRRRRRYFAGMAQDYAWGDPFPQVDYNPDEQATWNQVFGRLKTLRVQYACAAYLEVLADMERSCGYTEGIPQGRVVSDYLEARTGVHLWPVAGLLSARHFLNGLAFRVFFSTQYIRHQSRPLYTPEPDVCHELIGHAPMFADAAFADLSQEIGLASLGASDEEIERLARCYWYSVEFGLLRKGGQLKAYGAGLLSSSGELEYACTGQAAHYERFDPQVAANRPFPITEYQPAYFVADGLHHARQAMRKYCRERPRPFYARFNPAAQSIWVDRAVERLG